MKNSSIEWQKPPHALWELLDSYVWTGLNQQIFQFEKRIEFVCPFYAADFVPPYPKSRTLLKDYIYCCHDQCCNEVNKHMNKS